MVETRTLWHRYWSNAVEISSPDILDIGDTVREAKVFLCLGIVEKDGGLII